jgi:hypothetical protein
MKTANDSKTFTTSGVLLDSDGFCISYGVHATLQGNILIIDSTPHAIWDVRVHDDRIVSKASGWTLLF